MTHSIKAEFIKLLTARSTYFTSVIIALITAFMAIFVYGYKEVRKGSDSLFMADLFYQTLGLVATASVILTILLVAHEYRYNTINYTFTLIRRRSSVLLSKIFVMLTYSTVMAAAMLLLTYFGARLGLSLHDATLVTQQLPLLESAGQYIVYTWGYVLAGVILAVLLRSVVAAIVAFFLIPTVEGILSLILKGDTKYLPFRALDATAAIPNEANAAMGIEILGHMTAFIVASAYIAIFLTIAVIAFIKRDASAGS